MKVANETETKTHRLTRRTRGQVHLKKSKNDFDLGAFTKGEFIVAAIEINIKGNVNIIDIIKHKNARRASFL